MLKNNQTRLCASIIGLTLSTMTAQGAWLNVYGTPDNDAGNPGITPINGGDSIIEGETGESPNQTYWYARVDGNGQIIWSKSTGKMVAELRSDLSVSLFEKQQDGSQSVFVSGKAAIDLQTGALTVTSVEKNVEEVVASGKDRFSGFNNDRLFTGSVTPPPPPNKGDASDFGDAGVAKLDANNQVLWSHAFHFGGSELFPRVEPLSQGYFMAVNSSERDPRTFDRVRYQIIAKLDANGGLIPGSAKRFLDNGDSSVDFDEILADGGILFSDSYQGEVRLIKFDSNLNLLWSKKYQAPLVAGTLGFFVVESTPGPDIEVATFIEKLDAARERIEAHPIRLKLDTNTGNIRSQVQFSVRTIDPTFFNPTSDRTLSYFRGATSQSQNPQDQDGLFALFDSTETVRWARAITGSQQDVARYFYKDPDSPNFEVIGETQSWGAGKKDAFFGRLDANGTISNCSAIQEVNITKTDPGITATDVSLTVTPATGIDRGPINLTVQRTEKQYSLNPQVVDYPLTVTKLCSAPDTTNGKPSPPPGQPPAQGQPLSNPNVATNAQVSIQGSGFTSRKGSVKIGRKSAKVVAWTDKGVSFKLPSLKAGTYTVRVVGKNNKTLYTTQVTIYPPQISGLSGASATSGAKLTLSGLYFGPGNPKPKVYFALGRKKKAAKVLPGSSDTTVEVIVPKLKPGAYAVTLTNGAGSATAPSGIQIQ